MTSNILVELRSYVSLTGIDFIDVRGLSLMSFLDLFVAGVALTGCTAITSSDRRLITHNVEQPCCFAVPLQDKWQQKAGGRF